MSSGENVIIARNTLVQEYYYTSTWAQPDKSVSSIYILENMTILLHGANSHNNLCQTKVSNITIDMFKRA